VAFDVGLFVDQLWMNFAPVYFEKVMILKNHGYNMAYWNLHERKLVKTDQGYFVNDLSTQLVFFHFSGYVFSKPEVLSKYQNRFQFADVPEIVPLFETYHSFVTANGYSKYSKIACYYVDVKKAYEETERKKNNIVKRSIKYAKRKGWLGSENQLPG
jgi:hypothetical protein